MNNKIALILGTRPEFIKFSPIIHELQKRSMNFFLIHSSQHYDDKMDAVFFRTLNLPKPDYRFHIGGLSRSAQVSQLINDCVQVFKKEAPSLIAVEGDTNTVLAAALAGDFSGVKIAHVEAGLRSFDRSMPEEMNRIITDHLSSILFAPTDIQKQFLINEGIEKHKIHVVGNTISDAVLNELPGLASSERYKDPYLLLTLHRPVNVDNSELLSKIIVAIVKGAEEHGLRIIFPIHPRTKKSLQDRLSTYSKNLLFIDPVGFREFLQLEKNAEGVITDSGGVQEEACILCIPCITFRTTTERQETVQLGSNLLVKKIDEFSSAITWALNRSRDWQSPYGDGSTSNKIVELIENL